MSTEYALSTSATIEQILINFTVEYKKRIAYVWHIFLWITQGTVVIDFTSSISKLKASPDVLRISNIHNFIHINLKKIHYKSWNPFRDSFCYHISRWKKILCVSVCVITLKIQWTAMSGIGRWQPAGGRCCGVSLPLLSNQDPCAA